MLNNIDALSAVGSKVKLEVHGGKVKKLRRQSELEELAALIEWADKTVIDGIRIGDYLIHIPNEGKRGPKAARDAKRLGVRAGVPDLFLALPRGGYAGMWIEMKSTRGTVNCQQLKWLTRLAAVAYKTSICKRLTDAKMIIERYIMSM
ncbi:TPA: VRR-NUC domain-containing protein [Serratia marcescens]|uniref:VRR-NUC domain-containing protein n=1 Tax=Serratia marcescens TaxID=615 RepID=UPI0021BB2A46|nr:VRR-NUC domain-containing protein [Serratia marcescens]HEJ7137509.1 VRR-NUC domain-containing protein [Serratia marcescens]HEJ7181411.1 VRR-NUC domain-containing protein [Serratia marcescens]HEJ7210973.1 VRR-NUC domain-containing protein [Serratia marcescens]